MYMFLVNIVLAIIWMALTASFSVGNLLFGFVLSFIILAFCSRIFSKQSYARKIWLTIKFILFILWELIVSSLKVASDVFRIKLTAVPGVIGIPLETDTDLEITLLANLISLTPGTLTLDVSSDKKTLFVHTMFAHDIEEERRLIKEKLEKRLLEITR